MLNHVNQTDEWVIVGRFGRPHGIKGMVSVVSFTEPRENILDYPNWHICQKGRWIPLKTLNIKVTHHHILTEVEGYPTREDVATLTNLDIAISRSLLPTLPAGEYYWSQLVGMRVTNLQGVELGEIQDIMPTGANDVLVVVGEKRHLVPYITGQYVIKIDDERHSMIVDWDADF